MIFMVVCILMCARQLYAENMSEKSVQQKHYEEIIPPTEDLMREHGLLNRILIIYEETAHDIERHHRLDRDILKAAVTIVRDFIEQYHEKMEENYIFPLFEKHKKHVRLVKILREQHEAGRIITAQLERLLTREKKLSQRDLQSVARLLRKFIRMYRAHEAREDTVIFSEVRHFISQKDFEKLAEIFEDTEHELFGKDGFEGILKTVQDLERQRGIADLAVFTPQSL